MALSAVSTQLTVAREHALLGDYSSAVVYYAGVLSQVDRYLSLFTLVLCCQRSASRNRRGVSVQAHADHHRLLYAIQMASLQDFLTIRTQVGRKYTERQRLFSGACRVDQAAGSQVCPGVVQTCCPHFQTMLITSASGCFFARYDQDRKGAAAERRNYSNTCEAQQSPHG